MIPKWECLQVGRLRVDTSGEEAETELLVLTEGLGGEQVEHTVATGPGAKQVLRKLLVFIESHENHPQRKE